MLIDSYGGYIFVDTTGPICYETSKLFFLINKLRNNINIKSILGYEFEFLTGSLHFDFKDYIFDIIIDQ